MPSSRITRRPGTASGDAFTFQRATDSVGDVPEGPVVVLHGPGTESSFESRTLACTSLHGR